MNSVMTLKSLARRPVPSTRARVDNDARCFFLERENAYLTQNNATPAAPVEGPRSVVQRLDSVVRSGSRACERRHRRMCSASPYEIRFYKVRDRTRLEPGRTLPNLVEPRSIKSAVQRSSDRTRTANPRDWNTAPACTRVTRCPPATARRRASPGDSSCPRSRSHPTH